MAELRGRAPAKVNLVLEVLGRRRDGYHEIDTILQTLELADEVILTPGDVSVGIEGPFAEGTPAGEGNLVLRALDALRSEGVAVPEYGLRLVKRIPPAGGLGGGASDAATALRLAGTAAAATPAQLLAAANAVGSDEAFFLAGGTARARGRGERVASLTPLEPHDVVLFIPPETIERKTQRMFNALGASGWDTGAVAEQWAASGKVRVTSAEIHNAFERVAFDLFEGLPELHETLETRVGQPIRLAGAGPTLFWVGSPGEGAGVAAAAGDAACTVITTRTAGA